MSILDAIFGGEIVFRVDTSRGMTFTIKMCEDKSGYVARIRDHWDGEVIKTFFASEGETAQYAAQEWAQ